MNIRTILVPTDFSDHAGKALTTAKELAQALGAKIVVLHAYHVDVPMISPMAGGAVLPQSFYDDLRAHAKSEVEKLAATVAGDGVEVTGVALGDPAGLAIIAEAERLPADLIVMGTHGHTGLKHVVLGSVAERIVRTAPCPVLTVKADA